MAIIDVVKWNASDEEYAWKYPSQELSTWTQLIVSESQEAVLLSGGVMSDPFRPGRHTLSTENLPFLVELLKVPFGHKSPFTAEVWFVNKAMPLDVKWGTADPIQLQDPKYGVMLPVRAFGQFAVQIVNTRDFITKLVGTAPGFDRQMMVSYFKGLMLTHVKHSIANYIVKQQVSVLEISAYLKELSSSLRDDMAQTFQSFGVNLVNFYINSINTPEDDPAVEQLKAALAKRAEMNILGYTYQQERTFDTVQIAAGNEGIAGTIMGAGMGTGMGLAMGVGVGNTMGAMVGQGFQPPAHPTSAQTQCPKCTALSPAGSAFCSSCGAVLSRPQQDQVVCPKCGAEAARGSRFCPGCGGAMVRTCSKCGVELVPSAKFCAACGSPA